MYAGCGRSAARLLEESGHTEALSHSICWLARCFRFYTLPTWAVLDSPLRSQPQPWIYRRRAPPARKKGGKGTKHHTPQSGLAGRRMDAFHLI